MEFTETKEALEKIRGFTEFNKNFYVNYIIDLIGGLYSMDAQGEVGVGLAKMSMNELALLAGMIKEAIKNGPLP